MNGQPWFQAPTAAPKLAQSEEAALVLRWRDEGDVAAGARVVSAHLPYVMRVASKFRGAGLAIDDLIAEGCLGLLHAMTKYEPDRGLRLLTYATHWIHAYLRTAVTRAQSVVSGDVRARMTYVGSIRSRRAKLEATLKDDDAIDAAVAAQVGMPVQRVREIARRVANRDASLDDPDASERPLAVETSIDDDLDRTARQSMVRDTLARIALDRREHYLLAHRLMADDDDRQTLEQVGRCLGVSRERARQLEMRLKKKLSAELSHLAA